MKTPSATALLEGHRVLVTGGARGLGLEFARTIAQHGGRVVIADILADAAQQSAADLRSSGLDVRAVPLDLDDADSITACAAAAGQALGGLDGLVNNGAITNSGGKTMGEIGVDAWDAVMNVNVRGTWLATAAAHPHLRASGRGRVVNLASDTALWGAPKLMAYVASKGAVIAMTRSMARELGADGITVNAIAPGLTLVEATQYVPQERHEHYMKGRAIARQQVPGDVTSAVLFLLSPAAGFITGQVLPVNGGFVMN